MLKKVQIVEKVTLSELRQLTGLSIAEFAKSVDIPESSWRRYEETPDKIEFGKLMLVCQKIGVTIDKISI